MKIIAFVLMLFAQVSYGQHVLVKMNGQKVPLKKQKFNKDDIQVIDKEKKAKSLISVDSVVGIYDEAHQIMYYNKPSDRSDGIMGDWSYQFVERVVVGRINLYKKSVSEGTVVEGPFGPEGPFHTSSFNMNNYGGPSEIECYYIEKDEALQCVFVTNASVNKKNRLQILKSFVSDDVEIQNKVEGKDFSLNERNLIRLIKEYNIKNFKPIKNTTLNMQMVGFYTKVRETLKDDITLKVNDSLEFKLPESQLPLPINLSLEKPSKVCVIWESGSACEIILPSPFAVEYYELVRPVGGKSFEIQKRSIREFKDFIIYTQKH